MIMDEVIPQRKKINNPFNNKKMKSQKSVNNLLNPKTTMNNLKKININSETTPEKKTIKINNNINKKNNKNYENINKVGTEINKIMESDIANYGINYSKNAINEYITNNLDGYPQKLFQNKLKEYFNIDQKYILSKLLSVFFPFIYIIKNKKEVFLIHDLLIPLISLFNFIFIYCFINIENNSTVNPSDFIFSKLTFFTIFCLIESFLIKIIIIIGNFDTNKKWLYLDIVSICSYKFFSLVFYSFLTFINLNNIFSNIIRAFLCWNFGTYIVN